MNRLMPYGQLIYRTHFPAGTRTSAGKHRRGGWDHLRAARYSILRRMRNHGGALVTHAIAGKYPVKPRPDNAGGGRFPGVAFRCSSGALGNSYRPAETPAVSENQCASTCPLVINPGRETRKIRKRVQAGLFPTTRPLRSARKRGGNYRRRNAAPCQAALFFPRGGSRVP